MKDEIEIEESLVLTCSSETKFIILMGRAESSSMASDLWAATATKNSIFWNWKRRRKRYSGTFGTLYVNLRLGPAWKKKVPKELENLGYVWIGGMWWNGVVTN
jgi:hypothetical protein